MSSFKQKVFVIPAIIGAILIAFGLYLKIPGGALTTYGNLDGDEAERYVFDNRYAAIDEYVGGDAYNYIIGSNLVGARMTGTMTAKAVCITGGFLCICIGFVGAEIKCSIEEQSESSASYAQSFLSEIKSRKEKEENNQSSSV